MLAAPSAASQADQADQAVQAIQRVRPRLAFAKHMFDNELTAAQKFKLRPVANGVVRVHNATLKALKALRALKALKAPQPQPPKRLGGGMFKRFFGASSTQQAVVSRAETPARAQQIKQVQRMDTNAVTRQILHNAEEHAWQAGLKQLRNGPGRFSDPAVQKKLDELQGLQTDAAQLVEKMHAWQEAVMKQIADKKHKKGDQPEWEHLMLRALITVVADVSASSNQIRTAALSKHARAPMRYGIGDCGKVFGCRGGTFDDACYNANTEKWQKNPPPMHGKALEWLGDCRTVHGSGAQQNGNLAQNNARIEHDLKLLLRTGPTAKVTDGLTKANVDAINRQNLYSFEKGSEK